MYHIHSIYIEIELLEFFYNLIGNEELKFIVRIIKFC